MEEYEFLFNEEQRYCVFPIKYDDIWREYKNQLNSFWTAEVIDYTADKSDWNKLNKDEKYFIEHILAFFAGADGIVLENLITDFCKCINIPEVQYAYGVQAMMEAIHCVGSKTLILTDKGYFPIKSLENQWVNVWNGNEFSNVEVKYTGNSSIYRVKLNNGMDLECTSGHKWLIRCGNQKHPECCKMKKIETKDLKIGDIIYKYKLPFIDIPDIDEFQNPYIHGFFCGDGSYCNGYPTIDLYDKKEELLKYFNPESYSENEKKIKFYITRKINKPKFEVPINYSLNTKLRWLEGFCVADGCISYNTLKDSTSIQLGSINKPFLKDIQLMLTTIGINTTISAGQKERQTLIKDKIYNCKKSFVLYISTKNVNKLITMKFEPKRLKILYCSRLNINISNLKLVKIKKITKISENKKTYCFNEPKNNTGIFNGILTGQSESYALLINTYIDDEKRKNELFNAIQTIDCVKKKADWALKWIDVDQKFSIRLLAFSMVEGIFFSGSFCAIFWLKNRGLMVKTLGTSNELIARDEAMHVKFAVLLYSKIKNKIPENVFYTMLKEAVEIETNFICESLPCRLIGMNSDLMKQYIEFVADRLSVQLGYNKLYMSENPFDFMNDISLDGKSNFFEKRVTEYRLAINEGAKDFVLDENF